MPQIQGEVVAPLHKAEVRPAGQMPVAETKWCPWCNTLVEKISSLCRKCGFKFTLPHAIRRCPNCSEILFAFSVLCPSCRYDIRMHYERLKKGVQQVESEVRHLIEERAIPVIRRTERRAVDMFVRRRRSGKGVLRALSRTRHAPEGLRCFRCGGDIPPGSSRCPKCRLRCVL